MTIGDAMLITALKQKMHWHQARQAVLSENVANADTPHYQGRDLKPMSFATVLQGVGPVAPTAGLDTTNAAHIAGRSISTTDGFSTETKSSFETTPNGNSVSLEEEMIKTSENQIDFQAVSSLYQRSLALIKMAIGKAG